MKKQKTLPPIEVASAKLRALSLQSEVGDLLGGEDALCSALGVSRTTVRQSARLLEREGLIRVKRGLNGGYFAARPNEQTIEGAVSAYLDTLDMEAEDITLVASALWVEALRKAANVKTKAAREVVEPFRRLVSAVTPETSWKEIATIEQDSQKAIFELSKARYIELIFHINAAFSTRRFPPISTQDQTEAHRIFVKEWQAAKLLELAAVSDGDPGLAVMAGRHARNVWHTRIWGIAPL